MYTVHVLDYINNKIVVDKIWKFTVDTYSKSVVRGGDDDVIIIDDWEEFNTENFEHDRQSVTKKDSIHKNITDIKINQWKGDINIYKEDKVSELKEKLQIITGIEVYKQHLFYYNADYPIQLSYNISGLSINIYDTDSWLGSNICGIPTSEDIYANRDSLIVESYEEFRLVKDIINVSRDLYLISIDSFFKDKANIETVINDIYTRELLYYSFVLKYFPMISLDLFSTYIINESEIADMYPLISPPIHKLLDKYKKETQVFEIINAVTDNDLDKVNFSYSITSATIVSSNSVNIDLRNLFDMFCCSLDYPFIKCKTVIDGQNVELTKIYKLSNTFRDKYPDNSIIFGIVIDSDEVTMYATLIILHNGTYHVKINFRDDLYVDFNKLYAIVEKYTNPLITIINSYGKWIMDSNLQPVTKSLTKINDLTMSIYWRPENFNSNIIKLVNKEFKLLVESNIISYRQNSEYFFNKSMYRFNHRLIEEIIRTIPNYYSRYYDTKIKSKWDNLFTKNRLLRIYNRYSDIKFEINNVKDEEKDLVWNIMVKFIYHINNLLKNTKLISDKTLKQLDQKINPLDVSKKLKKLKELDPELYEFKKTYQSKEVLSKKCQKPLQPIMFTDEEYKALDDKKSIEVYHNFTTNKPAYYKCPNPDFPYIQYIVGVHPKGYCIPCCKKTIPKETNPKKFMVQKTCKDSHVFIEEATEEKKTKYVNHWGKDINSGKLCFLPDEILGKIFNNDSNVSDQVCVIDQNYFVLGVHQTADIGIIFACSVILNKSPEEIMEKCYNMLIEYNLLYKIANGITIKLFNSVEHFKDCFDALFKPNNEVSQWPWNTILLDLISRTYDINPIIFNITGNQGYIEIPGTLQKPTDIYTKNICYIVSKYSSDVDQTNKLRYYPIVYCSKEAFYKDGTIVNTLFDSSNLNVQKIYDIINSGIKKRNNDILGIDLFTISDFIDLDYTIDLYYVNSNNNCYAILLSNKKTKLNKQYVPLALSYYKGDNATYDSHGKNHNTNFIAFEKLIDDFNTYCNKNNILPVTFTKRIVYNGKNIGLVADHNWYMDIPNNKYTDLPIMEMLYDPYIINKLEEVNEVNKHQFNEALYRKYIYHLMTISFINYWNMRKNTNVRKSIVKALLSPKAYELDNILTSIKEISKEDIKRIKNISFDYKDTKNKEKLLKLFNDMRFEFDKLELNTLRKLDHHSVVKTLHNVAKDLFIEKPYTDIDFPNILLTCSDNIGNVKSAYCNNSKLIILPNILDGYLELLANDILNPLKYNIISVRSLYDSIIDPYNFIEYPYNTISINIIDQVV
jgi:hypothetical protein